METTEAATEPYPDEAVTEESDYWNYVKVEDSWETSEQKKTELTVLESEPFPDGFEPSWFRGSKLNPVALLRDENTKDNSRFLSGLRSIMKKSKNLEHIKTVRFSVSSGGIYREAEDKQYTKFLQQSSQLSLEDLTEIHDNKFEEWAKSYDARLEKKPSPNDHMGWQRVYDAALEFAKMRTSFYCDRYPLKDMMELVASEISDPIVECLYANSDSLIFLDGRRKRDKIEKKEFDALPSECAQFMGQRSRNFNMPRENIESAGTVRFMKKTDKNYNRIYYNADGGEKIFHVVDPKSTGLFEEFVREKWKENAKKILSGGNHLLDVHELRYYGIVVHMIVQAEREFLKVGGELYHWSISLKTNTSFALNVVGENFDPASLHFLPKKVRKNWKHRLGMCKNSIIDSWIASNKPLEKAKKPKAKRLPPRYNPQSERLALAFSKKRVVLENPHRFPAAISSDTPMDTTAALNELPLAVVRRESVVNCSTKGINYPRLVSPAHDSVSQPFGSSDLPFLEEFFGSRGDVDDFFRSLLSGLEGEDVAGESLESTAEFSPISKSMEVATETVTPSVVEENSLYNTTSNFVQTNSVSEYRKRSPTLTPAFLPAGQEKGAAVNSDVACDNSFDQAPGVGVSNWNRMSEYFPNPVEVVSDAHLGLEDYSAVQLCSSLEVVNYMPAFETFSPRSTTDNCGEWSTELLPQENTTCISHTLVSSEETVFLQEDSVNPELTSTLSSPASGSSEDPFAGIESNQNLSNSSYILGSYPTTPENVQNVEFCNDVVCNTVDGSQPFCAQNGDAYVGSLDGHETLSAFSNPCNIAGPNLCMISSVAGDVGESTFLTTTSWNRPDSSDNSDFGQNLPGPFPFVDTRHLESSDLRDNSFSASVFSNNREVEQPLIYNGNTFDAHRYVIPKVFNGFKSSNVNGKRTNDLRPKRKRSLKSREKRLAKYRERIFWRELWTGTSLQAFNSLYGHPGTW